MAYGHRPQLHPHIRAVMKEMREDDPFAAVRAKARSVIKEYHSLLGEEPPFNLEALASSRGLRLSDEAPRHSKDSEIAPEKGGRVVMRINRDRPKTRQRFSIGHEIGHTLFPEYQLSVHCRKATDLSWADPEDLLETLCDVAASEFLFPEPWFHQNVAELDLSAAGVVELAGTCEASREATIRRLIDVHETPLAAVFFSWKRKPTELREQAAAKKQMKMFKDESLYSPPEKRLRVDYAVVNGAFAEKVTDHIPKDKSVPSEGVIFEASVNQDTCDGEMYLDLGSTRRVFAVHALPIYNPESAQLSDSGTSVAAIIQPVPTRRKAK
jgi:Zn-dependent peptidase ImmA (M78 family)